MPMTDVPPERGAPRAPGHHHDPPAYPRHGNPPGSPTPPPRRNRAAWIAGGIVGAVVLVAVVVVLSNRMSGATYPYRDDLCDTVDLSPVLDIYETSGTDHREQRGEDGRTGMRVCEYDLETSLWSSDLRLTAETWPDASTAQAKLRAVGGVHTVEPSSATRSVRDDRGSGRVVGAGHDLRW